MHKLSYKIINGITIYRIVAAPLLVYFVFSNNQDLFKWFLTLSFFTDLIDGHLARQFKVVSLLGSTLDSIGDDLTILAAVIGTFVFKFEFIHREVWTVSILLSLIILQYLFAFIRYGKITSFHTLFAKTAAILQGTFFILLFFLTQPVYFLFYAGAVITMLELIEEIILVVMLPQWEADIKGIYWVLKRKRKKL